MIYLNLHAQWDYKGQCAASQNLTQVTNLRSVLKSVVWKEGG